MVRMLQSVGPGNHEVEVNQVEGKNEDTSSQKRKSDLLRKLIAEVCLVVRFNSSSNRSDVVRGTRFNGFFTEHWLLITLIGTEDFREFACSVRAHRTTTPI